MKPTRITNHKSCRDKKGRRGVVCTCNHCGQGFCVTNSDFRRGRGLFCSRQCSGAYSTRPLTERFWEKIDKTDSCWVWTGYTMPAGHGQIQTDEGTKLVHRISWELHNGPIPDGMNVCHKCDNPPCIRPDHLFLGEQIDNVRDAISKNRMNHSEIALQSPVLRGEKARYVKLTRSDVEEILQLLKEGQLSQREIGELKGVAQTTISDIANERTWTHIPRP